MSLKPNYDLNLPSVLGEDKDPRRVGSTWEGREPDVVGLGELCFHLAVGLGASVVFDFGVC